MLLRRGLKQLMLTGVFAWLAVSSAMATEYHGVVTFGGLPLPGTTVTVTATQGAKKVVAISNDQGFFSFPDLADGTWALDIEMTGFAPIKQEVTIGPNAPAGAFEMKLMTLAEIREAAKPVKVETAAVPTVSAATTSQAADAKPGTPAAPSAAKSSTAGAKGTPAKPAAGPAAPNAPPDLEAQQANDGLLINGSVNNAATSQYSLSPAFGNSRNGGRSLYNGSFLLRVDNSALDAQQFSLTGVATPKPQFNNLTGGFNFGGPLNIPRLMPRGPYFGINYSRTENSTVNTQAALIPTPAEVGGDLSGISTVTAIYAPTTGLSAACLGAGVTPGAAFAGNIIPAACISGAAKVLLGLYPQQPNIAGNLQYNYQLPLTSSTHSDSVGISMQKQFGNKNNVNGRFNLQSNRSSTPSIFVFLDKNNSLGLNAGVNWSHRFTQRLSLNAGYNFSRNRSQAVPFFANRTNIQSLAGIAGASTAPAYWGPPSLSFSSGIAGLSDGTSSYNRPETNSISLSAYWNHFRHNVQFGGDLRRQEFNYLSQTNPYGSLSFDGVATRSSAGTGGSDFADFLLGLPDTSAIAYGNADKYFRQSVYDLFVTDDFRVNPELSVSAGLRWEYGAPITELKGRLVNLDIAPGFTAEAPVLATNPVGSLTGQHYPTSLVHPDYSRPEPRIGIAWRPISGSSLLVRAGYDVTNDTSVYSSAVLAMAQQAPLSTSLSIANSASCRFTIASPFAQLPCSSTTPDTFAIDPNFKVGYVQTWNLSAQRDLPFSLQSVVTYLGTKGTRGVQEYLPNTCPPAATGAAPCTTAPSGYFYRTSNGNLTREAGSVELRRRLRSGFQARLLYTYSKSLDDDYSLSGQGSATASGQVAQDWTNPSGQRGLSTSDQRHVLSVQAQYTTGMGLNGKSLMSGWKGLAYKEWTVQTNINAASGTPETPIYLGVVPSGSGITGTVRPNLTGLSIHSNLNAGYFLNSGAYAAPVGQWGNARRDSIPGPNQFSLNASMQRTFRLEGRYSLDAQMNLTNALNHVVYTSWNTGWIPSSTTFGAPQSTGSMRSVSLQFRLRF